MTSNEPGTHFADSVNLYLLTHRYFWIVILGSARWLLLTILLLTCFMHWRRILCTLQLFMDASFGICFSFFSVQENFLALRRVRGLYPSQKSLYTGSSIFCRSLYIIAVVISCISCQKRCTIIFSLYAQQPINRYLNGQPDVYLWMNRRAYYFIAFFHNLFVNCLIVSLLFKCLHIKMQVRS